MPGAVIVIDQLSGAGAGTPGVPRDDLWEMQEVTLHVGTTGNTAYEWELLAVPPGSASSIDSPSLETCHFIPDMVGSYRIRLITNGGGTEGNIQILVARVRFDSVGALKNRGWAYPAIGEQEGESASRGWAGVVENIFEDVRVSLDSGGGGTIDLGGDLGAWSPPSADRQEVVGLRGRPVAPDAPSTGDTYRWTGAAWEPKAVFDGVASGAVVLADASGLPSGLVGTATNQVVVWNGSQWTAGSPPASAVTALGGDLDDWATPSSSEQQVIGLRGRALASAAPASGDTYKWSGTQWEPKSAFSGVAANAVITANATGTPVGIVGASVGQALLWDGTQWGAGSVPTGVVTALGGDLGDWSTPASNVQQVVGLRGRPLAVTPPTTDQFYRWTGTAWAAQHVFNGMTAGALATVSATGTAAGLSGTAAGQVATWSGSGWTAALPAASSPFQFTVPQWGTVSAGDLVVLCSDGATVYAKTANLEDASVAWMNGTDTPPYITPAPVTVFSDGRYVSDMPGVMDACPMFEGRDGLAAKGVCVAFAEDYSLEFQYLPVTWAGGVPTVGAVLNIGEVDSGTGNAGHISCVAPYNDGQDLCAVCYTYPASGQYRNLGIVTVDVQNVSWDHGSQLLDRVNSVCVTRAGKRGDDQAVFYTARNVSDYRLYATRLVFSAGKYELMSNSMVVSIDTNNEPIKLDGAWSGTYATGLQAAGAVVSSDFGNYICSGMVAANFWRGRGRPVRIDGPVSDKDELSYLQPNEATEGNGVLQEGCFLTANCYVSILRSYKQGADYVCVTDIENGQPTMRTPVLIGRDHNNFPSTATDPIQFRNVCCRRIADCSFAFGATAINVTDGLERFCVGAGHLTEDGGVRVGFTLVDGIVGDVVPRVVPVRLSDDYFCVVLGKENDYDAALLDWSWAGPFRISNLSQAVGYCVGFDGTLAKVQSFGPIVSGSSLTGAEWCYAGTGSDPYAHPDINRRIGVALNSTTLILQPGRKS